jgi:hypothetical protein
MITAFNSLILSQASKLKYRVADQAPGTELELFNGPKTLVIWSGASENTIFGDARVNWAFRALHDALHLKTGIGFSPEAEIELGRIQANQYTGLLADLVYIEVSGQAQYYLQTGRFVEDQIKFTMERLKL